MKSNRRIFGVLLATAVVSATIARSEDKPAAPAAVAAAKPAKADDLFPDPVVAKGKGLEIKQSQIDEAVSSFKATAISQGKEVSAAQMPQLQKQIFERLLLNKLVSLQATDADRAKGKEEGEKRYEIIKKRAPSEEVLIRQMKAIGLTLETLHSRLIEEATPEIVLRSKVTVTDEQVKKFYDDNPSQFEEPEMVKASHILLMTSDPKTGAQLSDDQKKAKHKLMEDLLKRARAGEDFGKLATEYSEDTPSKQNGGEYTFPRGRMVQEFEAAAFTLKTNQISDIVTTTYGYHIIKLKEKIPAKKMELDDKVKSEIRDYLVNKEIDKMLPAYFASLRKEAKVEILDPQLKELDAQTVTPPATKR